MLSVECAKPGELPTIPVTILPLLLHTSGPRVPTLPGPAHLASGSANSAGGAGGQLQRSKAMGPHNPIRQYFKSLLQGGSLTGDGGSNGSSAASQGRGSQANSSGKEGGAGGAGGGQFGEIKTMMESIVLPEPEQVCM
jgi:hypothetical protein